MKMAKVCGAAMDRAIVGSNSLVSLSFLSQVKMAIALLMDILTEQRMESDQVQFKSRHQ